MLDLKALNRAIETIAQEKGIDAGAIFGAIEAALAAAYRKEYRKKGELIKCKLNPKTGDMKFSQVKLVVDESTVRVKEEFGEGEVEKERTESDEDLLPVYNPDRHIWLKEAKEIKSIFFLSICF